MAQVKYDIKNLKEGLALVFSIMNAAGKTLEDGKVSVSDIPHWIPVSMKIGPALTDFKQIWPEIKDLDKNEVAHLEAWGKDVFDIPQESFERYFELGYGVLLNMVELYSRFLADHSAAAKVAGAIQSPPSALALSAPVKHVDKTVKKAAKAVEKVAEKPKEVVKSTEEAVKEAESSFVSRAKKSISKGRSKKKD